MQVSARTGLFCWKLCYWLVAMDWKDIMYYLLVFVFTLKGCHIWSERNKNWIYTEQTLPPGCCDSYLESVAGEAQAQLSADHHGLHGSPAFAAHRPPHQRAISLHQHLYTTLMGVTTTTQTQLCVQKTQ